jgi:dTDP-4-amino-4,6-dideoxygalactose transaminase
MAIAEEHDLLVVEDAAQAHGAEYKGRKVGSIGHVNAFSMQDSKILTTSGDGGMVTTDTEEYALFCSEFRNHGFLSARRHDDLHVYIHPRMGYNYRMTEIQAAIGLKAMDRLDGHIAARRANAAFLTAAIEKIEGLTPMAEPRGCKCTYYVYYCTMALEKFRVSRDQFVRAIQMEGVSARIGTSAELYMQEFFQKKDAHSWDPRIYKGKVDYTRVVCPVARKVGQETFALEVAPPATVDDMADAVAALQKVSEACRR